MGMAPLDYGPVLLRRPFGSRLAADTLPSGCPCGRSATVGASPWLYPSFPTSCPHRVLHGCVPQPTRHYPRLWIGHPSSGRPRDLNPPDQNAAQHTLRACPSPRTARPFPRRSPVGDHAPPPRGASRVASDLLCRHAIANTPVGPLVRVASRGVTPCFPVTSGLPRFHGGSAPTLSLSGPAQRSLALRPACSRGRQGDPFHRRLRRFRYLHRRSDCYRLERPKLPGGICTR